MSKKMTLVMLSLAVIAFLVSGCQDAKKVTQLESQVAQLNQLLMQKDVQIKTLAEQAQVNKGLLESVKKELDMTKKELNNLIANLAPQQKSTTQ